MCIGSLDLRVGSLICAVGAVIRMHLKACSLVEQKIEFLDDRSKKERVRGHDA